MLPGMYEYRVESEIDRFDSFEGQEQYQDTSDLRLPTAALFVFRSLAIDYLWIRAENLKQQGQYFDAQYLARAICALQPNLASIWDFQGWNMVYNISVCMPTGSERWEWVRSGIEMLRDSGLKYNPRSLKIHWSIAYFFQHKIGAISDDYHRYYKTILAYEMARLVTPCYVELNTRGTYQDMEAMAALPTRFEQLLEDKEVAELVKALIEADEQIKNTDDLLDALVLLRISAPDKYSEKFNGLIRSSVDNPALWSIDRFSRARQLRSVWKLEPKVMHELNTKYGPVDFVNSGKRKALDWRTPWAQSIYWADRGMQFRDQDWSRSEDNVSRLDRMIYQSLQQLYHYGNVKIYQFRPETVFTSDEADREVFDTQQLELQLFNSQDLEMFLVAYQATIDLEKSYEGTDEQPPHGMDIFRRNLVSNAIESMYLSGYMEYAQKYFKMLQEDKPDEPDYQVTLEEFVRNSMKERIKDITPHNASQYVISLLSNAYYQLAIGEEDTALVRQEWAQQIYDHFLTDFQNDPDPTQRTALPPMPELRYQTLIQFLNDESINMNIKDMLMGRIELEQPRLYDRIMKEIEQLRQEYEKSSRQSDTTPIGPQPEGGN